ncbi:MAG: hypothetical protein A2145_02255, partial [candidate division Zixibacteria bacterium RBG_16_40_9]
KVIAGVCSGLGEYFKLDPVLVRLIWLVAVLVFGTGILAYILAWIFIPQKPEDVVEVKTT